VLAQYCYLQGHIKLCKRVLIKRESNVLFIVLHLKNAFLVLCLILNTEQEIKMYSWKPNVYMIQPYYFFFKVSEKYK